MSDINGVPQSASDYLFVRQASDDPRPVLIDGGIYPLRSNFESAGINGKRCLRGEDILFLKEAIELRLRLCNSNSAYRDEVIWRNKISVEEIQSLISDLTTVYGMMGNYPDGPYLNSDWIDKDDLVGAYYTSGYTWLYRSNMYFNGLFGMSQNGVILDKLTVRDMFRVLRYPVAVMGQNLPCDLHGVLMDSSSDVRHIPHKIIHKIRGESPITTTYNTGCFYARTPDMLQMNGVSLTATVFILVEVVFFDTYGEGSFIKTYIVRVVQSVGFIKDDSRVYDVIGVGDAEYLLDDALVRSGAMVKFDSVDSGEISASISECFCIVSFSHTNISGMTIN